MKIGLDIMGGDFAPEEAIKGVLRYFKENTDSAVHLLLFGNPDAAAPYLSELEPFRERYTLIPASQIISMDEHPTKALKEKPDSSIAIGFGWLKAGKADAFISAGNTGAMMVGAMYSIKAIDGILRPTIASPMPRTDGRYNLLLDVGANADCKPEHLVQFATIGSLYVQRVWGISQPRVALLNLGEEEGKGNLLAQATYPLLKARSDIHFVGNVEGRDLFSDKAHVIVCEGFVGNVMLKMAESIHNIFMERGVQDAFLHQLNYETYGGTPILGVNAPVIIGHGISPALAFKSMIEETARIIKSDITHVFREYFSSEADTILPPA